MEYIFLFKNESGSLTNSVFNSIMIMQLYTAELLCLKWTANSLVARIVPVRSLAHQTNFRSYNAVWEKGDFWTDFILVFRYKK